jgi:ribonucleotide monophosphatase NagD (HAD superfamily)
MATIVCDIDGTLIAPGGDVITGVRDFVDEHSDEYTIAIVTARQENRRMDTTLALSNADVTCNRLLMNKVGPTHEDGLQSKKENVDSLSDVVLAIDNDADVRALYESMGIKTVAPGVDLEAALAETHNEGEDPNSMMD